MFYTHLEFQNVLISAWSKRLRICTHSGPNPSPNCGCLCTCVSWHQRGWGRLFQCHHHPLKREVIKTEWLQHAVPPSYTLRHSTCTWIGGPTITKGKKKILWKVEDGDAPSLIYCNGTCHSMSLCIIGSHLCFLKHVHFKVVWRTKNGLKIPSIQTQRDDFEHDFWQS